MSFPESKRSRRKAQQKNYGEIWSKGDSFFFFFFYFYNPKKKYFTEDFWRSFMTTLVTIQNLFCISICRMCYAEQRKLWRNYLLFILKHISVFLSTVICYMYMGLYREWQICLLATLDHYFLTTLQLLYDELTVYYLTFNKIEKNNNIFWLLYHFQTTNWPLLILCCCCFLI